MKRLIALIFVALLAACGSGEADPQVVIGDVDRACRDSSGIEVACK